MVDELKPAEGWDYLQSLPESHSEFILEWENCWDGLLYRIFSYRNPAARRSVGIVYDKGTLEYMLRIKVGLTEFCDVRFIHPDRQAFEHTLQIGLLPLLEMLKQCEPERMETLFRNKKIVEWGYERFLPQQLQGFDRYLCPRTCVQVTNGSYLILDYSDFSCDSSLRFFYNVFRDDFFAEFLIRGVPEASQAYDSKTLTDFEACLKKQLEASLVELRQKISGRQTDVQAKTQSQSGV